MLKNLAKRLVPAVLCASVGAACAQGWPAKTVTIVVPFPPGGTTAEFRKQMLDIGAEPVGNKPEEMARQIHDESERFASVVKTARIALD